MVTDPELYRLPYDDFELVHLRSFCCFRPGRDDLTIGTTLLRWGEVSDRSYFLTAGLHLRAYYNGVQFWSGQENSCDIPGCLGTDIILPGSMVETNVTIDYTYDGLYRLTAADYSDGAYFHYTYDPVGNRLTQETQDEGNSYLYDEANRLVEVDDVAYLWDDNGNLLFDGESFYNYDYANRLTSVNGAAVHWPADPVTANVVGFYKWGCRVHR